MFYLLCKKRNIVVLDTPICLARAEQDVPLLRSFITRHRLSMSIFIFGASPFLRHRCTPSFFLRAKASLVRMEIKLRSISAINPKANPSTLLLISF